MQRFIRLLVVCLVFLCAAGAAYATDVIVDCTGSIPGSYPSLSAALAAIPPTGPNSIGIFGACSDNSFIYGYSDLIIYAADSSANITAANPNRLILTIDGSSRLTLYGIAFTGGRGIGIFNESTVFASGLTIQNSNRQGVQVFDSLLQLDTTTIANNGRNGLYVDGSTVSLNGGVTLRDNGRYGVIAGSSSKFTASDGGPGFPNVFQNNQAGGVGADGGCYLNLAGDNRILNNGSYGILILHTTTLYLTGGAQVSGNAGPGLHIGETSHGEFTQITVQNNGTGTGSPGIEIVNNADGYIDGDVQISGNGAQGILVDWSSVLASLGGNTISGNMAEGIFVHANGTVNFIARDSVAGNGNADLACDTTSLVSGDISGIANVKCARVERGTGRRYPAHAHEKP